MRFRSGRRRSYRMGTLMVSLLGALCTVCVATLLVRRAFPFVAGALTAGPGGGAGWGRTPVAVHSSDRRFHHLSASGEEHPKGAEHWNPIHNPPGNMGPLGWAGIFLWIPMVVWVFSGVAIVADAFFQPSLEHISDKLELSEDVRGATFLAAASSAPEFFTSFADTFLVSDEGGEGFGIGTIVGSAVFNILIIVALSTLPTIGAKAKLEKKIAKYEGNLKDQNDEAKAETMTKKIAWMKNKLTRKDLHYLKIDWYPLFRDCLFYAMSIVLVVVSVATHEPDMLDRKPGKTEGCVVWWESLIYILLYLLYIIYMVMNQSLRAPVESVKDAICCGKAKKGADDDDEEDEEEPESDEDEEQGLFAEIVACDGPVDAIATILVLPFKFLFTLTIPQHVRSRMHGTYIIGFLMCILWIGLLSAFMVKLVGWIGAIIGLHPVAMGLIVLAAGTSVPDAIGSYNEAKKGHAGAAVSNALGSNVFDICFGLGVPWFFFSVIKGRCFSIPKDEILIPTFILFGVLGLFIGTLAFSNMRLKGQVGMIFLSVYVLFVIWVLVNAYALGNIKA